MKAEDGAANRGESLLKTFNFHLKPPPGMKKHLNHIYHALPHLSSGISFEPILAPGCNFHLIFFFPELLFLGHFAFPGLSAPPRGFCFTANPGLGNVSMKLLEIKGFIAPKLWLTLKTVSKTTPHFLPRKPGWDQNQNRDLQSSLPADSCSYFGAQEPRSSFHPALPLPGKARDYF